ncbi:hypothetical protein ACFSS8_19995 [Paracoccus kondratievae]
MTQTTDNTPRAGRQQLVVALHQYGGILVSLVLLCVIFTLLNERFMTVANLTNILQQVAVVAIAAFGMTWVILLGKSTFPSARSSPLRGWLVHRRWPLAWALFLRCCSHWRPGP